MKLNSKLKNHLNQIIAYHVDSTTLADGDYQLISEPEGDNPEDTGNIIGDITEAPNPGSENSNIDIPDSSPTNKGKPRCITQYFKLLHYAILYLYIISCIKSRS
jgi:hypothetical protein